ncbi:MAG: hypothetical protein HKN42_03840 [Granulosicoccus sp.]|nr:hypothetical protein [Granulosicoccus sp.]
MRHALAPGIGDPEGLDLRDCATQRNLSQAGRRQAREAGATLKSLGIVDAEVFSSAWCRCIDTATGLELGPVTVLDSLNSFFRNQGDSAAQTHDLGRWIEARLSGPASKPAVLVTHQVNISGLIGRYAASGEAFILGIDEDELRVLDSLQFMTP